MARQHPAAAPCVAHRGGAGRRQADHARTPAFAAGRGGADAARAPWRRHRAWPRESASATEPEPPVKLNPIQANERQVLLQLLEQHRWNVSNVAKALDVSRNTLYRKLHKLHIEVSHPE